MKYHEIINFFIQKNRYRSYLQIGFNNKNDEIKCSIKNVVDPYRKSNFKASSDNYFRNKSYFDPVPEYDIIFLDCLYLKNQFIRDVQNCLSILSDPGIIICKSCAPRIIDDTLTENMSKDSWCGEAYLGWLNLRFSRSDIMMGVFLIQNGIGVIKKGFQKPFDYSVQNFTEYVCTRYHSLPIYQLNELNKF